MDIKDILENEFGSDDVVDIISNNPEISEHLPDMDGEEIWNQNDIDNVVEDTARLLAAQDGEDYDKF